VTTVLLFVTKAQTTATGNTSFHTRTEQQGFTQNLHIFKPIKLSNWFLGPLRICAKLKYNKIDGRMRWLSKIATDKPIKMDDCMRLMSSITLKRGWTMDATDEPITTTSCTEVKLHGSTFDVRIEAGKKIVQCDLSEVFSCL
jgi:hypothetical protein